MTPEINPVQGKFYVSKTGEAMRVVTFNDKEARVSLFESNFLMEGEAAKLSGLFQSTGAVEITEDEYKKRTVAMRIFQDCKLDKDYPFKTYHGQYDELITSMAKDTVDSFFEMGGGYRDYDNGGIND
jgi:hypothetical protein